MSTKLAARYPQCRPDAAMIMAKGEGKKGYTRGGPPSPHPREVCATAAQDKVARPIASQSIGESISNRIHADNTTKINQYLQPSTEVSY